MAMTCGHLLTHVENLVEERREKGGVRHKDLFEGMDLGHMEGKDDKTQLTLM